MGKHQPAISRRGFVAASGAVALGAGLGATATGCSSGGDAAKGGDAQKEDKWVPTTCNMCFNQCSILAHVVDGKVVELKGNPDSPVGRGHICQGRIGHYAALRSEPNHEADEAHQSQKGL